MSGVLALAVAVLAFSMLVLWYTMRAAVMDRAMRPAVIRGSGRMALFSLLRLLTTAAGVAGVWYAAGFVAALLTYIATDVFRFLLRRAYTASAVREMTEWLMDLRREECKKTGMPFDEAEDPPMCREIAAEQIQKRISGKEEPPVELINPF